MLRRSPCGRERTLAASCGSTAVVVASESTSRKKPASSLIVVLCQRLGSPSPENSNFQNGWDRAGQRTTAPFHLSLVRRRDKHPTCLRSSRSHRSNCCGHSTLARWSTRDAPEARSSPRRLGERQSSEEEGTAVDAEGAVTAASRPGGRSPGGAADAVGRREETAVVDFGQVESDATGHGLAAGTLARWATRGSELSAMSRRTAVERGRRKGPSLSSEIRRR